MILIGIFLLGVAVGLVGSYGPRELYVRSVLRQARGCPCGRDARVLIMTIGRPIPYPIRFTFLRCDYHAQALEDDLVNSRDVNYPG